jgi:hypothetical protein
VMRISLLCIQCKNRSLEHVRDSWISKYVLTFSIVFQNLLLVPCMCYWSSDSRILLHQNWRPGHIRSRIWTFYIWLEPEFHRASNGTSPTSKFLLSRREWSTQVGIQNLSGCCVTVCWAVGPCTVLEPIRVASRGLACLQLPFIQ